MYRIFPILPQVFALFMLGCAERTEGFFSEQATKFIQKGRYEKGIDYVIEGAGNFVVGKSIHWSFNPNGDEDPFITLPLRELHAAVRKDRARTTIRKKLQKSLESAKDFSTVAQSQQFRAVVEMQIALGFEDDAIPALKTTWFMRKSEYSYLEPLWSGMTVMQFQLRCGLFDEAMATYSKITFTDRPDMSGRPGSDDRTQFLQWLTSMLLAHKKFDQAEKIIELAGVTGVKPFMLMELARAYQRSGDFERALEIIDALGPPSSVRLVMVSGWSPPPPPPETHRAIGYLMLLEDILKEESRQEQHMKKIETVLDRYCTEINKTEEPQIRYQQYYDVVALLYQNDQRESAMQIVDEVDSPYYAAWILLNHAAAHEIPGQMEPYVIVSSRVFSGIPRYYSGAHTEDQVVAGEYNSPDHYLDIASAMKSAKEIVKQAAERYEKLKSHVLLFEPDWKAMKVLLDKAAVLIDNEKEPIRRATVLGAIGKMEYIYSSKENAQKYFNEALELLKLVESEPDPNMPALELLEATMINLNVEEHRWRRRSGWLPLYEFGNPLIRGGMRGGMGTMVGF